MLPTLPSNRDTLFPASSSRYRPLGQIGRGGMAEVILAEMAGGPPDAALAVLKRIWPHLASEPGFLSMFRHEARVCASLDHPNVVKTYELLEGPEGPAIAMEYLDGQPLARVLNRLVGPDALSITLRIRIVSKVLAGLHYAHELNDECGRPWGIVHRDVNPQNVFITYNGEVKLVDFGVAKSLSRVPNARPFSAAGKVAYMAPEQLHDRGRADDRRADIFSVGVVLWEMIAGRRLWSGMTEEAIIRHLSQRIPVPALAASAPLSSGLAKIVARALSYDPERRYPTAAAFAEAMQPLLPGSDDAHGRRLGHVVSLAFAKERAARKELIERPPHTPSAEGALQRLRLAQTVPARPLTTPPPPPPPEAFLDRSRPTPGGLWSLNDPTPSGLTIALPERSFPGGVPGARARSFLPLAVGPRWPRARWAAFGGGLAAATLILGVVLYVRNGAVVRASTLPPDVMNSSTATAAGATMGAVIVAPMRARSVIPWPLDATTVAGRPPLRNADTDAAATVPLTAPLPPALRSAARPLEPGTTPGLGARRRAAESVPKEPPSSPNPSGPAADDDVLAPTVDLTIEDIADTADDEKGTVPADVEADLARDLAAPRTRQRHPVQVATRSGLAR